MRNADWLPFCCGDRVVRRSDPRHIGRVEGIRHGAFILVKWEAGWFERLKLSEVGKAVETLTDRNLLWHYVRDDGRSAEYEQYLFDEIEQRGYSKWTERKSKPKKRNAA